MKKKDANVALYVSLMWKGEPIIASQVTAVMYVLRSDKSPVEFELYDNGAGSK